MARSSSDSVAIRHVLPVLWMTSHLAVMSCMATSGVAIPGQSLMSVNALFVFGITDVCDKFYNGVFWDSVLLLL